MKIRGVSFSIYEICSLCILSDQIRWDIFEEAFKGLYSPNKGRPANPIRNLSDESVGEQWSENIYF